MSSFDIDGFLQALSPAEPCGENLEYDAAFMALEEEAKGTPEKQVGEEIVPAQPPSWKSLNKQIVELMGRTRDLRLLVEFARIRLNLEGLGGFKSAIALLRNSLETYWETIHPQLDPDDDNDPTTRVNILMMLCDVDKFTRSLQHMVLVDSRAVGRFSLRDVQLAMGKIQPLAGETPPSMGIVQGAFADVPVDEVLAVKSDLQASLDDVISMENYVTQQVGIGNAPNLAPLREVLKEALHVVGEQLDMLGGGVVSEVGDGGGQGVQPVASVAVGLAEVDRVGGISTRADVVKTLGLIEQYYVKNEPSSPVPLLLRRAKRLVNMDFLEIIQDLAPGGMSEVELIRGNVPDESE